MELVQVIENAKNDNVVFNPSHNEISVRHTKGRGMYVHLSKIKINQNEFGTSTSRMLMDDTNFSVLIKPLARTSKKAVETVENAVKARSEELFTLYQNNDRIGLKSVFEELKTQLA